MITLEDCYGFCDLEQDIIQAIADHEHLNEIVAIEFAQNLLKQADGIAQLHAIIQHDIEIAKAWGKLDQAHRFEQVLKDFDNKFQFVSD